MPIYEYYCAECEAEFEMILPVAQADEPATCEKCGSEARRQLTTFSFKSDTFTAPRLKHSTRRPLRGHKQPDLTVAPEENPKN